MNSERLSALDKTSPVAGSGRSALVANSRREMWWQLCVWIAMFCWVVGYGVQCGYTDGPSPSTTLGMPSWVVWGVFVPWVFATAFTIWFALAFVKDDDLEAQRGQDECDA